MQPKVNRLGEMQHELAHLQQTFQQHAQKAHAELVQMEADILALQRMIAEEMRKPMNGEPLPTVAPIPTLSLVAPPKKRAVAAKLPHRPIISKHPFPKAVGNVKAWATSVSISYTLAKSWYTERDWKRPIPRAWAVYLARNFKIPLTAWWKISDDVRAGGPTTKRA